LTAQQQAEKDLDRLVRDYYAAENAVYLDPARDPSAALDPYLRNPASAARIADILSFRSAGHTLESSSVEVHWVKVTSVDMASGGAAVAECHTTSAAGTSGSTGEPSSFSNTRTTAWNASRLESGDWRLSSYESGEPGPC
jgi:hypothetical protein